MRPFGIKYLETALVWYNVMLEFVLYVFFFLYFVSIWSTFFATGVNVTLTKASCCERFPRYLVPPAARRASDGKKGRVFSVLSSACKWLYALLSNPLVVGWTSFSVSYVQIRTCIRLSPGWRGWRFVNCCVGGVRLPRAVVERGGIDHYFGLVECVNCWSWMCKANVTLLPRLRLRCRRAFCHRLVEFGRCPQCSNIFVFIFDAVWKVVSFYIKSRCAFPLDDCCLSGMLVDFVYNLRDSTSYCIAFQGQYVIHLIVVVFCKSDGTDF